MSSKYEEINLSEVKPISISDRRSKVRIGDLGKPVKGGKTFSKWFKSLPRQLAASEIRELVTAMRRCLSSKEREIIWMAGAHVVKCGLSLYLIELMRKHYISILAVNGAFTIHDLELAFFGETSEDVPESLKTGTFGFAKETAEHFEKIVDLAIEGKLGLGEAIGRYILKSEAPYKDYSVLAQAYRFDVPVTVHVAVGTDILIEHQSFDGAKWGELSARDFRIFAARVFSAGESGGVVINVGSAVILPEVFLKAFSVARNLGADFKKLTTCNIDMIQHYRPNENVLRRPTEFGGKSIGLTGHHELLIPLIYSALFS